MANQSERLEILKMVQSNQITPEDGARLLKAIADEKPGPAPAPPSPSPAPGEQRWLKIHVEEAGGERASLAIPLQAVPLVLRFASRFVPDEHREPLDAAATALTTGFRGEIVRVEQPGGELVRIWIE